MFFCLPIIYDPFGFLLIFGGLDGNYPQTILYMGYINLMRNVLDDHEKVAPRPVPSKRRDRLVVTRPQLVGAPA